MFFEPNLSESIYLCDYDATYIELLSDNESFQMKKAGL